jgi:Flp pilus assembly secretin CpaC
VLKGLQKAKLVSVLAEPKLVVRDGRPAQMHSGGEFPIVVPTAGSVTGQTIEYREFGVRVEAIATLIGSDRVRLEIQPEVSQRDFTNAVQVLGVTVPGLKTRRFHTQIEMKLGETAVLCQSLSEEGRKGQLASKQFLVLVTPQIVDTLDAAEGENGDAQPQTKIDREATGPTLQSY